MVTDDTPRVIALEEHYWDADVARQFGVTDEQRPAELRRRLEDLGALRLKEMDEAGIDMQVLSHSSPAVQNLDPDKAIPMARAMNDRLHEFIQGEPRRFAGFAALPTSDPDAAADELERAVVKLGLKGAMVHGLTRGRFFDERQFWPIFERAQTLDVPLYLHPSRPHPAVIEAYYKEYVAQNPALLTAGWGYTVETATQGVRLVLSGVFDAYPRLKIILGHLGEGLPFLLWRIDHALSRPGNRDPRFREQFCEHVYITTSGNFSDPALLCCILEMGVDRILFSVDWPFVPNMLGTTWINGVSLAKADKLKILGGNARRLLRI